MKRIVLLMAAVAVVFCAGCWESGKVAIPDEKDVWISGDSGNDVTGSGTISQPYRTFLKAFSVTSTNVALVVKVFGGTYNSDNQGSSANPSPFPIKVPGGVQIVATGQVTIAGPADVGTAETGVLELADGASVKSAPGGGAQVTIVNSSTKPAIRILGANSVGDFLSNCAIDAGKNNTAVTFGSNSGKSRGRAVGTGSIRSCTFSACKTAIDIVAGKATIRNCRFYDTTGPTVHVGSGADADLGTLDEYGLNTFNYTSSIKPTAQFLEAEDAMSHNAVGNEFGGYETPSTIVGQGWDLGGLFVAPAPKGNDNNDGSFSSPLKTISAAIADPRIALMRRVILFGGVDGQYPATFAETSPIQVPDGITVMGTHVGLTTQNNVIVVVPGLHPDASVVTCTASHDCFLMSGSPSALAHLTITRDPGEGNCVRVTGSATLRGVYITACAGAAMVNVVSVGPVAGVVDLGTTADPGLNWFKAPVGGSQVILADSRGSGSAMFAIDDWFHSDTSQTIDPPMCGVELLHANAGGWIWRVKDGPSGHCP